MAGRGACRRNERFRTVWGLAAAHGRLHAAFASRTHHGKSRIPHLRCTALLGRLRVERKAAGSGSSVMRLRLKMPEDLVLRIAYYRLGNRCPRKWWATEGWVGQGPTAGQVPLLARVSYR